MVLGRQSSSTIYWRGEIALVLPPTELQIPEPENVSPVVSEPNRDQLARSG